MRDCKIPAPLLVAVVFECIEVDEWRVLQAVVWCALDAAVADAADAADAAAADAADTAAAAAAAADADDACVTVGAACVIA